MVQAGAVKGSQTGYRPGPSILTEDIYGNDRFEFGGVWFENMGVEFQFFDRQAVLLAGIGYLLGKTFMQFVCIHPGGHLFFSSDKDS